MVLLENHKFVENFDYLPKLRHFFTFLGLFLLRPLELFCSCEVIALVYCFGKMVLVTNHNGGNFCIIWCNG